MKFSINHIRYYRDRYHWSGDPVPNGVEKLAEKIGAQLGAIEEVIDFGSQYKGVVIVKLVSCVDHPNANRLHICRVDDGSRVPNVERDENGHVQIICGAPNVREGMLAAWLPPGSTVPSTIDKDPFVLEARPIRGEISNGMLASPRELGIGDSHEGILEIDEDVTPGTLFAEHYGLVGDYVIDIENKMFTHRPDCFGMMGIAREIAGIQQQTFKSPDWYQTSPEFPNIEGDELRLEVKNELPELVSRFTAITMRDVKIGSSPVWLQIHLARLGLRPINNVVDLTNYFMILTGQPLHAYDYDKVMAQDAGADHATILVRKPHEDEKILLLNGKEIVPKPDTIMIATRDKAIGVGGVMGGSDTEVDENTKNIIIECANFDMYSIRRTSMAHGLFTDAVTRFNKGQSPLQNLAVLAKIVDDVRRLAGGKVASAVIDDNHLSPEMSGRGSVHAPVEVAPEFINVRLGLNLSADEITKLLENVEFKADQRTSEPADQLLTIAAPFWRTDIEIPEDIVEEVGRLYGYDKLPLELPKRDLTPAPKDQKLELKAKIRDTLSRAGTNEVLTYSFVHGNLLDKVGQDKARAFQIANALSPDLQYYRMSLTPSLLEKIHPNIKAGHDEFALFEIGKAHVRDVNDKNDVPSEFERVAFVFAANDKAANKREGAPYYQARMYLIDLLAELGIADKVRIEMLDPKTYIGSTQTKITQYEIGRTASIVTDKLCLGEVGEYKTSVHKVLKLPDYCAGFELDVGALRDLCQSTTSYVPLPRFPKIEQDICLKVATEMPYRQLFDFVQEEVGEVRPENTLAELSPIDIYQREDDKYHKQITFRLSIASYDRTLTDVEVSKLLNHVAEAAKERLGAERI